MTLVCIILSLNISLIYITHCCLASLIVSYVIVTRVPLLTPGRTVERLKCPLQPSPYVFFLLKLSLIQIML